MRILIVDCYAADDPDANVVRTAHELLRSNGHEIDLLSLDKPEFAAFMSPAEREVYESDQPLIDESARASAARVLACDALLFCYPTTLFGLPPRLKSWLERVMVKDVAFTFSKRNRIRGGLHNVRRLGVVTTTPHSAGATRRSRDLGRRTLMRAFRLNCHPACRRTFVRIGQGVPAGRVSDQLKRQLGRW